MDKIYRHGYGLDLFMFLSSLVNCFIVHQLLTLGLSEGGYYSMFCLLFLLVLEPHNSRYHCMCDCVRCRVMQCYSTGDQQTRACKLSLVMMRQIQELKWPEVLQ